MCCAIYFDILRIQDVLVPNLKCSNLISFTDKIFDLYLVFSSIFNVTRTCMILQLPNVTRYLHQQVIRTSTAIALGKQQITDGRCNKQTSKASSRYKKKPEINWNILLTMYRWFWEKASHFLQFPSIYFSDANIWNQTENLNPKTKKSPNYGDVITPAHELSILHKHTK